MKSFEPNYIYRFSKKTIKLTFQQWEYRGIAFVEIGGNCTFVDMLSDFQEKSKPYQEIHELLWLVPAQRRSKKAAWYIKAFTINDEERQKLLGLCNAETTTIAELAARMNVNDIHV